MKNLKSYVAGVITGLLLVSVPIFADSYSKAIDALVNSVNIQVNGKAVTSDNLLVDGKTYVWIRDVAGMFGSDVVWDENTSTANITNEKTVATVGDFKITSTEFGALFKTQANGVSKEEAKKSTLDRLIQMNVVLAKAAENGMVLNDTYLEQGKKIMEQYKTMYGDSFEQILSSSNLTYDQYATLLAKQLIEEDFFNSTYSSTTISAEDMQAVYDKNKDSFLSATTKHILLKTTDDNGQALTGAALEAVKKEADKLYTQIKNGADFDKLMKEKSQDEGSKNNVEGFSFGKGEMVPEYETAAFSQDVGKYYAPIKSSFGYHIVLVTKRGTLTLEEVNEKVKQIAFNDYFQKQLKSWEAESTVNINQEVYDSIK